MSSLHSGCDEVIIIAFQVQKMLKRMLNKEIEKFSSVYLMKTILNISPLVSDLSQEAFRPHKLLDFAQRCRVAR